MVRGAIRGALATAVMTAIYGIRSQVPIPPQVVNDNGQRKLGLPPRVPWQLTHLGIGMTLGAVYEQLPAPVRRGVPFGVSVWAASYATTLPALGLYPRLGRDDTARAAAGLGAHVVFGAFLD
jgi:hypothetical protein